MCFSVGPESVIEESTALATTGSSSSINDCVDSGDYANVAVIDLKERTYAEIEKIAGRNKRGKESFCVTMLDSEGQWVDISVNSRRAILEHGKGITSTEVWC